MVLLQNIFAEITGSNPGVHKGKEDQKWLSPIILYDPNCF